MSSGREVELKLEIAGEDAGRLRAHPLLERAEASSVRQVSTYFDTAKGALREAGYSLRLRRLGGRVVQTVKASEDAAAGLFDREEWETDVEGEGIDFGALAATPVAELLDGARRRKLKPVVTVDVERTVWRLARGGAEIELNFDAGTISGGKAEAPLHEIEAELKRGEPDALFGFARSLAAELPVRIGVLTKADRGFALAEGRLGQPAKAEPVRTDAEMSMAEGLATIVHACLRHYRLNEPLIAATRDASALHQARVAMRRLRSAFSLFGPALADAEYRQLREELKWFTNQLGDARNFDVFLKRLPTGRKVKPLRKRLEAAREQAYDRVAEALDARRLREMMLDLVRWAELGDWRGSEEGRQPLARFAEAQLDRRWRKVKKRGRDVEEMDAEPRHRLRIDVKKLRYAVEFLAGLYPAERLKPFTAALEDMQESLGELNDMETAREMIAALPEDLRGDAAPFVGAEMAPGDDAGRSRKLLADAQAAHGHLAEAGPFWRSRPTA